MFTKDLPIIAAKIPAIPRDPSNNEPIIMTIFAKFPHNPPQMWKNQHKHLEVAYFY